MLAWRPRSASSRDASDRWIVGDTLFVHGGVLPKHVQYGLARINRETQAWLRGDAPVPRDVVLSQDSPVWTRRYSVAPDAAACAELRQALEAASVRRMVVAHTVHDEGITSYCDDAVWVVDVGMSAHYGGPTQALEIRGQAVRVLGKDA